MVTHFFGSIKNYFLQKHLWKISLSKQFEDQYVQGWNLEVEQNRKCNNYRIFKEKHCLEKYLLVELNFLERTALCHLRTGNHKLPISKQRYNNDVDVNCPLCEENAICDEFHVIFECKFFDETRKTLLKKFYYNRPNTLKMSILFNTDTNLLKLFYHNSKPKFIEYLLKSYIFIR